MKSPVNVAVTGGAGQISYSLLFAIAQGQLLGKDQPINLNLLEITPALSKLEGVVMELDDCAYPCIHNITISDNPEVAFKDADIAFLVGSRPRSKGMERGDLLKINGAIFTEQGRALDKVAKRSVKVLVVGNPANTNALVAQRNAPGLDPRQFTAMTRLDHNRALSALAAKLNTHHTHITNMMIWGNHSATQYPDLHHAQINNKPALSFVDHAWYEGTFIPNVQQRGAKIIEVRGASSAASAASAALDHMRDWVQGASDIVSMAVYSQGEYGIEPGLIYSFPCRVANGDWQIVEGLDINAFSRARMDATAQELIAELDAVVDLLP